jgi:hypothetical protein
VGVRVRLVEVDRQTATSYIGAMPDGIDIGQLSRE